MWSCVTCLVMLTVTLAEWEETYRTDMTQTHESNWRLCLGCDDWGDRWVCKPIPCQFIKRHSLQPITVMGDDWYRVCVAIDASAVRGHVSCCHSCRQSRFFVLIYPSCCFFVYFILLCCLFVYRLVAVDVTLCGLCCIEWLWLFVSLLSGKYGAVVDDLLRFFHLWVRLFRLCCRSVGVPSSLTFIIRLKRKRVISGCCF